MVHSLAPSEDGGMNPEAVRRTSRHPEDVYQLCHNYLQASPQDVRFERMILCDPTKDSTITEKNVTKYV